MKRSLISIVLVLALTLSLFAICVSAAETKTTLLPADATWTKTDHGEASVNVEYTDDAVVFSGSVSGTWPSVATTYAEPIVADVEDDYLSIDFTVAGGTTNMNFSFADGSSFSISNTALNAACPGAADAIDTGSGDIYDGEFKCTISIADLIASTMNLGGSAFPAGAIVDGQITFTGINVYSVNGATITVRDLSVVNVGEDAPVEPEQPGNTETTIKNVAAGLSYTISEQFHMSTETWGYDETFPASYPDSGNELTDGYAPSDIEVDPYSADAWMAFNQQTPAQKDRGYAFVKFDLGEVTKLSSANVITLKDIPTGIQPAHTIEVWISNDGENYTLAGEYKPDSDTHSALADLSVHTLAIDLEGSARYVEFRFASYGWNFLGELEINAEVAGSAGDSGNTDGGNTSKPVTGDAGILVFAVMAIVAIAGCATVVKTRG